MQLQTLSLGASKQLTKDLEDAQRCQVACLKDNEGQTHLLIQYFNSQTTTMECITLTLTAEGVPCFTLETLLDAFYQATFLVTRGKVGYQWLYMNPLACMAFTERALATLNDHQRELLTTYVDEIIHKLKSVEIGRLLGYLLFRPAVLEKLVKTAGPAVTTQHLTSKEPLFEDAKKFKKFFGLSPDCIERLSAMGYEGLTSSFKLFGEIDPNYPETLLDFIENYRGYIKTIKVKKLYGNSLYQLTEPMLKRFLVELLVLVRKGYQMKTLLGYLFKQTFLYGSTSFHETASRRNDQCFYFVDDAVIMLSDYIQMMDEMGLAFERFPAQLSVTHQHCVDNYKAVSKYTDQAFFEVVSKWKHLEVSNASYSICIPQRLSDLTLEGNALSHCVGSYAKNIIEEGVIVCFFRENKAINQPYVTLELYYHEASGTYSVVQAKEAYNKTVDTERFKAICSLIKTISVKKKGA